jgi:PAT family beta-lactamase induction signal transducer AmpG
MVDHSETVSKTKFDRRTTTWTVTTYFAEGLPFMIVRFISSVFFTDIGMREAYLGFLNFFAIPWNIKFLWAPIVDILGTKRGWLIKVQFLIGIFVLLIGIIASITPDLNGEPLRGIAFLNYANLSLVIAFLFTVLAFLSATHDIAIDAYYLEALTSERDQSLYSGLRVLAYRVAVIYAKSFLVILAAAAGWFWGFSSGALTMLGLFLFHVVYLKPTAKPDFYLMKEKDRHRQFKKRLGFYRKAFSTYLQQERVIVVLFFIVLYKLGDEILFSMNTPFLLRELGMTKAQLGWVSGILGTIFAIAGSLWGGKWIASRGLKKAVWPITITMNVTILAYALLAWLKPDPSTLSGIFLIAAINSYEQLAAGLGTAVLIVFLMNKCQSEFKAAHYAIGSAIMSLGGTLMGGMGGIFVELYGYINLFLFGFAASIPSMVLLFWVPMGRVTSHYVREE